MIGGGLGRLLSGVPWFIGRRREVHGGCIFIARLNVVLALFAVKRGALFSCRVSSVCVTAIS